MLKARVKGSLAALAVCGMAVAAPVGAQSTEQQQYNLLMDCAMMQYFSAKGATDQAAKDLHTENMRYFLQGAVIISGKDADTVAGDSDAAISRLKVLANGPEERFNATVTECNRLLPILKEKL